MGYVKVAYREIFRHLDSYSCMPNGWEKFVNAQAKKHNLIIKSSKGTCHCTNCNHDFISNQKVNKTVRCPNCKNKYTIRRSNLRYYDFKDYLSILDYINDTFVIRYFELKTIIDAEHKRHSSVVEFAREIPTDNYYRSVYVNDRVSKCQYHIYIYHYNSNLDEKKWRQYTRSYSPLDYSMVFPNNIKKLMKDTKFKYSCIWNIAKHSSYIDLSKLLKNSNASSLRKIELLTKLKLYNLALNSDQFNCSGTFQSIFGVSRDYYTFMRRNNITYRQLKILKLLQEKDIKKIHYLEKFVDYGDSTYDLEEISNYISLNRFIKYSKMHHGNVKTYLYKDYLRFAKLLGYDLKNNKYAFPKNLKEEHDKLEQQFEIQSKPLIRKAIVKRSKELSANKYQDNKFIIFPACTFKSLQDESKQQSNCVRTYAEKYAEGICDIYFMRDVKKPKQSLVTVEVKDNKVVQSRIKCNKDPNKVQLAFLKDWENKILSKAA